MQKIVITLLLLLAVKLNFAQKNPQTNAYEYYIELAGFKNKVETKTFVANVTAKSNVMNFTYYGFGSKFFILRTKELISENTFKTWLVNPNYSIIVFKQGIFSASYITKKKSSTPNKTAPNDKTKKG
jgi:hypothetical protein